MHLWVQCHIPCVVRHEANLDPQIDYVFLHETKIKKFKFQGIPQEAMDNITKIKLDNFTMLKHCSGGASGVAATTDPPSSSSRGLLLLESESTVISAALTH